MANLMHINKDYAEQLVEKWSPVLDFKSTDREDGLVVALQEGPTKFLQ